MSKLTHIDASGTACMVDVGDKPETLREARAEAWVRMAADTLHLIESGGHKKGDVIAVARIAGIQAAKRCAELIPLCHPLLLSGIDVDITLDTGSNRVRITTACRLNGQTGVDFLQTPDSLGRIGKHNPVAAGFQLDRSQGCGTISFSVYFHIHPRPTVHHQLALLDPGRDFRSWCCLRLSAGCSFLDNLGAYLADWFR